MIDPNDPLRGSYANWTLVQPCGYKILVELVENREISKYKGTLEIPDDVADKYNNASIVGKVLQLGPDCYTGEKFSNSGAWCKPNDIVLLSPYSGTRVRSSLDVHKQLRLVNDDTIEAVLPDLDLVERG